MSELKSLIQIWLVQPYLDKFYVLLNRLFLQEEYTTNCFVVYIERWNRYSVRMFDPKNL